MNRSSKYKKNKPNNITYLIIFAFIILIFSMVISLKNNKKDNIQSEEEIALEIEENINNNITYSLKNMKERDRMEYYAGMFLGYIEEGKYSKAYDLLYDEFKQNYFPKEKDFEKYISTIFTEMTNIEHDNIERNGDVYVLWIYITDAVNGKPGEKKQMNIVIRENDYNDFDLSFSVI